MSSILAKHRKLDLGSAIAAVATTWVLSTHPAIAGKAQLESAITPSHLTLPDLEDRCSARNRPPELAGLQSVYSAIRNGSELQPIFLTQRYYAEERLGEPVDCRLGVDRNTMAPDGSFIQEGISIRDAELLRSKLVDETDSGMTHDEEASSLPAKNFPQCPLRIEWLAAEGREIGVISIVRKNDIPATALEEKQVSAEKACSSWYDSKLYFRYLFSPVTTAIRQSEDEREAISFDRYPIGLMMKKSEHFHCFISHDGFERHLVFDRKFFAYNFGIDLRRLSLGGNAASADRAKATSLKDVAFAAEQQIDFLRMISDHIGCSNN